MSAELAIRLSGVSKSYPIFVRPSDRLKQLLAFGRRRYYQEYSALLDVTLDVRRGESVAIIGRNGAGKSTLLQLICGTVRPTSGSLETHGRIAPLLELGAGFNPEFTGAENVRLAAAVLGLSGAVISQRYQSIIDFAEIGRFIDEPVKHYSSGMYARLAFAVAAHVDADILIVDEILSVGDGAFQQKCMRFIHEFRARGTLLLVSHSADTVAALCDRALWLDAGTVRGIGPAKELCHDYLAALSAERDNGDTFRIGGSRKQPRLLTEESAAAGEPAPFEPERLVARSSAERCRVAKVQLEDGADTALVIAEGGKEVTLRIEVEATETIADPVIFFEVRDRLGRLLFCDDTRLHAPTDPLTLKAGCRTEVAFAFELPHLFPGEFAVSAGVASIRPGDAGASEWLTEAYALDACFFQVIQTISFGLIGSWTRSITLRPIASKPASSDQAVSA